MNRELSLGNVIFADPTGEQVRWKSAQPLRKPGDIAEEQRSIKHKDIMAKKRYTQPQISVVPDHPLQLEPVEVLVSRKNDLTDLSQALAWLNHQRRTGVITKREFTEQHEPLADVYKKVMRRHMGIRARNG